MQKLFFKFKKILKICFFENWPNFLSNIKKLQKLFAKFFSNFFFEKFSLRKFFFTIFFFGENFVYRIFLAKIFFTIFSRISFVFDVWKIMYFAKFFIRNFAYCEFFCFVILVYGKNNCKFFLRFFFSAMNVNTKFENVSFLKKSKIFSDRTFGFLYSLSGK